MDQLFNACPCPCDGQIFQQRPQLHDKRNFTGREMLSNADGGNQRQRYQYVRFDVKGGNQTDDCFHYNRNTTEDNRNPCRVKWKWVPVENADQQSNT